MWNPCSAILCSEIHGKAAWILTKIDLVSQHVIGIKCVRVYPIASECVRMRQNVSKCIRMNQKASETVRRYKKCTKTHITTLCICNFCEFPKKYFEKQKIIGKNMYIRQSVLSSYPDLRVSERRKSFYLNISMTSQIPVITSSCWNGAPLYFTFNWWLW